MAAVERRDDASLVAAAQAGDRAALDALLRRHYDRVHAVCRRIAGSSRDADDAAQEAMISIVRALDRFDLSSWQQTMTPIFRALLTILAWSQGWPLFYYIVIWYVTDLGGDLYMWFLGWRELRRRDLLDGIRPTLRPTSLPGPATSTRRSRAPAAIASAV